METLVRRLFKVALFLGLFILAIRYVHTYPDPMTESQLLVWWNASEWLGIRDPEDLYFVVWVTIQLIVTIVMYLAIMKLWRRYHTK